MIPSVLVAAPTSIKKDYCVERYANQLRTFTYPDYDILIVDNSPDESHAAKLLSLGLPTIWYKPEGIASKYITQGLNIIRDIFLRSNYDYLCLIETDVFLFPELLEYMLMFNAAITNISYFYKEAEETSICLQGIVTNEAYTTTLALPDKPAFDLYKSDYLELSHSQLSKDMKLMAAGIGCTLIYRDVVEQIPFRVDPRNPSAFADSYFHLDAMLKGVYNILITSYLAEHDRGEGMLSGWKFNEDVFKMNVEKKSAKIITMPR